MKDVAATDDAQKYILDRLGTIETVLSSLAAKDARPFRLRGRKPQRFKDLDYYAEVKAPDGHVDEITMMLTEGFDMTNWMIPAGFNPIRISFASDRDISEEEIRTLVEQGGGQLVVFERNRKKS